MKTPYLDDIVHFEGREGAKKEFQAIKEALEPKFTESEVYDLLTDFKNDDVAIFDLIEKLGIKFKEPEIKLVYGEWYFVLKDVSWFYVKYRADYNWTNYEVREKNNPPTE